MNRPVKWRMPAISARTGARQAFIANVGAALSQIRANAAGAAAGTDPEYLHQLRIGIRRLRSTLRAFQPLLRRRASAKIDGQLRRLLRRLGAARDWDVFSGSLDHGGLRRIVQRGGAGPRQRATAVLGSSSCRLAMRRILAWSKASPWRSMAKPGEPIGAFAVRALERLDARLREKARGINWSNAAQRHGIRIKVKHSRYGCECFLAFYRGREARGYLKRLRKLQQVLGELNDIVVQRALLRKLPLEKRLRAPAAALRSSLAAREHALEAKVALSWRRFERAKPFWRMNGAPTC